MRNLYSFFTIFIYAVDKKENVPKNLPVFSYLRPCWAAISSGQGEGSG